MHTELPRLREVLRGSELKRVVFSQWVPFLRFAVLLRRVITGDRSFCAPLPHTDVQALLAALELPSPQAWLESPTLPRLFDAWAEHYRNFFGQHVASSEELDALVNHRLAAQEPQVASTCSPLLHHVFGGIARASFIGVAIIADFFDLGCRSKRKWCRRRERR